MDRALMDQGLVDVAVELGVTFVPNVTASLNHADAESAELAEPERGADSAERLVTLTHQRERVTVAARVVVLACGLGNRSAASSLPELQQVASQSSRVGIEAIYQHFPTAYAADTIHMVVARDGYVGLTQITGGRLHVAAAVDRRSLQQHGPGTLLANILSSAGAASLGDEAVAWRGTPPLTARARRLAAPRIFLVGDAAGYVEPFTGEGIRWALETGIGVAEFAERGCTSWDPRLIEEWEVWYRRRIAPEQRLCRQITSGLKHPVLRWLAHQTLRVHPRLASRIIQRLNSN
jgi:flavin-dependent dehydrogenase